MRPCTPIPPCGQVLSRLRLEPRSGAPGTDLTLDGEVGEVGGGDEKLCGGLLSGCSPSTRDEGQRSHSAIVRAGVSGLE